VLNLFETWRQRTQDVAFYAIRMREYQSSVHTTNWTNGHRTTLSLMCSALLRDKGDKGIPNYMRDTWKLQYIWRWGTDTTDLLHNQQPAKYGACVNECEQHLRQ
jgi:hypothetical protein